jgi:hypothetical protein
MKEWGVRDFKIKKTGWKSRRDEKVMEKGMQEIKTWNR